MKENNPLDEILSSGGILSRHLERFESREGQRLMAKQILGAYQEDQDCLIEAGTGIGKSIAYLVPAMLWAVKHKQRTVISTCAISLQEQLIYKDIPLLLNALNIDLKVVLIKGIGNYLCLRKLADLKDEVKPLAAWAKQTIEGSRSDLSFPVENSTWEKVAAEFQSCTHRRCPHFNECFAFKARKEAEEAQLLVVNHHLLTADVGIRIQKEGEKSLIPPYQRLIIDEAHHLESIAREVLSRRLDKVALTRRLGALYSEIHPERSHLFLLRRQLMVDVDLLETELPALKRQAQEEVNDAFATLTAWLQRAGDEEEVKLKIDFSNPQWQEIVGSHFLSLKEALLRLKTRLDVLLELLRKESIQTHAAEIHAISQFLERQVDLCSAFFSTDVDEKKVRWIERGALVEADLDVAPILQEHLFSPLLSSVLCSATLTSSQSFSFVKQQLGLPEAEEAIHESPFNYPEQALLLIPSDIPSPQDPAYTGAAIDACGKALEISKGGIFLLFTSYAMLQACHRELSKRCSGFTFLKQGDLPRHILIEQFKQAPGAVLFGTDSFWEGVDVPGDALRCVVLTKLPFKVPTDPLVSSFTEALAKQNKDPFRDYTIPQAVIKFKQGFGRLIRTHTDRGCVLCLDTRLINKSYGKSFLKSLPPARQVIGTSKQVFSQMTEFYKEANLSQI